MNRGIIFRLHLILIFLASCSSSEAIKIPTLSPTLNRTAEFAVAVETALAKTEIANSATERAFPTATETPLPSATPTLIGGYPGQFLAVEKQDGKQLLVRRYADGQLLEAIFTYPIDITDNYTDYSRVRWSPNGEAIAVLYWQEGGFLTLLRKDGTEIITIRTGIRFYGGFNGQANWSPDGNWLVFSSYGDNSYVDVYKIDSKGENIEQLTNTSAKSSNPIFTPDGEEIIYSQDGWRIMRNNGDEKRYLSRGNRLNDMSQDMEYYLSSNGAQHINLVIDKSNETVRLFTVSGSLYLGTSFFSTDSKWVYINVYDSRGEDPARGIRNWYVVPVAEPYEAIFLGSARRMQLSYDGTMLIFQGWLPEERMFGEPSYYAMELNGDNPIPLTSGAFQFFQGQWQPDSISKNEFNPLSMLSPTQIPSWQPFKGLALYDNFDDEIFNEDLWKLGERSETRRFSRFFLASSLHIESINTQFNSPYYLEVTETLDTSSFYSYSADIKVTSPTFGQSYASLRLTTEVDGQDWITACNVGTKEKVAAPFVYCLAGPTSGGVVEAKYLTLDYPILLHEWYRITIEFNREVGAFQYYLDNKLLGTYLPQISNSLVENVPLSLSIGVTSSDSIHAVFDNIQIASE